MLITFLNHKKKNAKTKPTYNFEEKGQNLHLRSLLGKEGKRKMSSIQNQKKNTNNKNCLLFQSP
jgi:hypothetical protein